MSEPVIDEYGNRFWYNSDGERHREDGPAIEYANGTTVWWRNGKLHRVDGPAIELANGNTEWYFNGRLHRDDGPAYEHTDGTKRWYLHGKRVEPFEGRMSNDMLKPKAECEGDRERCTLAASGACPLFGTLLAKQWRDGRRRIRGCGDLAYRNSINAKKGKRQESKIRKRLGIVASGDESTWSGPTRIESKKGSQVAAPVARIEAAWSQSENERPIGDTRPTEIILGRDGSQHLWRCHLDEDHEAYIAAYAESFGWLTEAMPVCAPAAQRMVLMDKLFKDDPANVTELVAEPNAEYTQTVPVWFVYVREQARTYIVPAAKKEHAKLLVLGRLSVTYGHLRLDWHHIEATMFVRKFDERDARLLEELGTTIKDSF